MDTLQENIHLQDTTFVSDSAAKSYLALGDSYTIGQSVDSAERYPAQTAAILRSMQINIYAIHYIAATGWTTLDLEAAINKENLQKTFDIVTLLIGVNDQYQKHDTAGYRENFTSLLLQAISFAGGKKEQVIVLSIPDYRVTPFGQNSEFTRLQIDDFNKINKAVSDEFEVAYVDVTAISRKDAGDNSKIAGDGLHPSGSQYAEWAKVLAPVMYNALK